MGGPAKFSSLANWVGELQKGDKIRVLDSKSSGIFGLGTDWFQVEYCENQLKSGWISTKLEGGTPTTVDL
ncbi:hypothetical protein VCR29J2_1000011 [Vibrio coralliirubri]|nr:hypothetical protein VCR29J2_1000011 [Vibrio coralliirubri]